jgi:hypothetical protein
MIRELSLDLPALLKFLIYVEYRVAGGRSSSRFKMSMDIVANSWDTVTGS